MKLSRPIENITDPRYVRALAHPMRVRILAILEHRTASTLDLARILKADLTVVAYHVRTLHRLGLLVLVRETRVRGAVQRHYRARERPRISDEAWGRTPPVTKQVMIDAALRQTFDYVQGAAAAGGFDRSDAHMTRTALRLDREGWEQLTAALRRLLEEVSVIEEDMRRRSAGDDTSSPVDEIGLVLMLFEALPFGQIEPPPGPRDH